VSPRHSIVFCKDRPAIEGSVSYAAIPQSEREFCRCAAPAALHSFHIYVGNFDQILTASEIIADIRMRYRELHNTPTNITYTHDGASGHRQVNTVPSAFEESICGLSGYWFCVGHISRVCPQC
jgi:hypothetical protein